MSARREYEEGAGPWVAYRDEKRRRWNNVTRDYDGEIYTMRTYIHSELAGSTSTRGGMRYDTRAEALKAARKRWPGRVKGCRIGAERVSPLWPEGTVRT